jgi:DnaK suppressor protein
MAEDERTSPHPQGFIAERKAQLERMRDELRKTLEMETEEFNEIFRELSTKDLPEAGEELADHRALGMIEVADRERMRSIASALYRIEADEYGICSVCGGAIDEERLRIKPDAVLCVRCKRRIEQEGG